MFKRDEKGFKIAKQNRALYVAFSEKTGKIAFFKTSSTKCRILDNRISDFITLPLWDYEWLTDEKRDRTVTTAADLYDHIEWTKSGFLIDGHRMKFEKQGGDSPIG